MRLRARRQERRQWRRSDSPGRLEHSIGLACARNGPDGVVRRNKQSRRCAPRRQQVGNRSRRRGDRGGGERRGAAGDRRRDCRCIRGWASRSRIVGELRAGLFLCARCERCAENQRGQKSEAKPRATSHCVQALPAIRQIGQSDPAKSRPTSVCNVAHFTDDLHHDSAKTSPKETRLRGYSAGSRLGQSTPAAASSRAPALPWILGAQERGDTPLPRHALRIHL